MHNIVSGFCIYTNIFANASDLSWDAEDVSSIVVLQHMQELTYAVNSPAFTIQSNIFVTIRSVLFQPLCQYNHHQRRNCKSRFTFCNQFDSWEAWGSWVSWLVDRMLQQNITKGSRVPKKYPIPHVSLMSIHLHSTASKYPVVEGRAFARWVEVPESRRATELNIHQHVYISLNIREYCGPFRR